MPTSSLSVFWSQSQMRHERERNNHQPWSRFDFFSTPISAHFWSLKGWLTCHFELEADCRWKETNGDVPRCNCRALLLWRYEICQWWARSSQGHLAMSCWVCFPFMWHFEQQTRVVHCVITRAESCEQMKSFCVTLRQVLEHLSTREKFSIRFPKIRSKPLAFAHFYKKTSRKKFSFHFRRCCWSGLA